MTQRGIRDVEAKLRDGTAIDRAIVAAQRRVILRHRQWVFLSSSGVTARSSRCRPTA